MEEEKKQSKRIQTSLLSAAEKKVLIKIANRLPRWTNSDQLTFIGFLGAVIIAMGFILANLNAQFLWLSILGFVINWYGDSLDGTLARVRNEQRPIYGFYVDHTMDAINELLMFLGAGMSPYMRFDLSCVLLIFYFMLSLNVAMNTHLKGEFCLTYGKLGPTEFRLVCIVACILIIAIKPLQTFSFTIPWIVDDLTLRTLDVVGGFLLVALIIIYFSTIAQDAKYYSKIDPKHKHD